MADFLFDATIHYTDSTTFSCTVDVVNAPNVTQATSRAVSTLTDTQGLWGRPGKTFQMATVSQRTRP